MKNIPKGQALELKSKLEAAGLNREIAQSIITEPNNELAKVMVNAALVYLSGKKEKQAPV